MITSRTLCGVHTKNISPPPLGFSLVLGFKKCYAACRAEVKTPAAAHPAASETAERVG